MLFLDPTQSPQATLEQVEDLESGVGWSNLAYGLMVTCVILTVIGIIINTFVCFQFCQNRGIIITEKL